jgi:hypothetical protein
MAGMTSSWQQLSAEAPDLAAAITSRFGANLHHVLGTIRPDGSVRLSGTEVEITDDDVRLGMMTHAHKLADVRRDPRVEIHAAPLDLEMVVGDAKLTGRLIEDAPASSADGVAFVLDITNASLVRVDGDELEFTIWSPSAGSRSQRRK